MQYILFLTVFFAVQTFSFAEKGTGEFAIPPEASVDKVIDLTRFAGDARVLLQFKARIDSPKVGGYAPHLQVKINGKILYDGKKRLVNKPDEFFFGKKSAPRKAYWTHQARAGLIEDRFGIKWLLPFSPDFSSDGMKEKLYWPTGNIDPFVFVIDISDLIYPGSKNLVTFSNSSKKYSIVFDYLSCKAGSGKFDRSEIRKIEAVYYDIFAKNFGRAAIKKESPIGREWCWDMRACSNYSGNMDSLMELANYDQALKRCEELKAKGFNTVVINGLHFRSDHFDKIETRILPYYKMFCKAAHEVGLKVIDHHDPTIFFYDGYPFANKHLDWLQRDLRYNTPKHIYCLNNPEYRKFYFSIMRRFQRECGIDAYQIDEVYFFDAFSCGCEYCRAAFKKATGFDLPRAPGSKIYDNSESELWHLWKLWQKVALNNFFKDLLSEIHKENPEAFRLTYTSSLGVPSTRSGMVFNAFTAFAAGCENMSRVPFQDYRYCFAHDKLYRGFGDAFRHASFILHYPLNDSSARFSWALECATGNAHWMLRGNFDKQLVEIMKWKHNMSNFNFDVYGDVGILFSSKSQYISMTQGIYHWQEFMGWSIAMLENNIQYAPLYELGLTPEKLAEYRLIILPNVSCLDKTVADMLRTYVKNGGIVLTTGNTGLFNQLNRQYPEFTAPELIPMNYDGYIQAPYDVLDDKGNRIFTFDRKRILYDFGKRFLELKPQSKNSKILYTFRKNNKDYPGIIETSQGNGSVINCAGFLGISNFASPLMPGRKQIFRFNLDSEKFMARLVREKLDKRESIVPLDISPGVRYSAFMRKASNDEIDLHLLNVTDNKRVVDVVIKRYSPKFPLITTPMVIGVRGHKVKSATLYISPENEGVECKTEVSGDMTKITIPANQLTIYGIVKIKLK